MSAQQARAPGHDCPVCPRLVAFRQQNRTKEPSWHNAPVPSFGGVDARLLIVGLAPGLKGANRTGRPFTGDFAGDLLYATLREFGWAEGQYGRESDDGFRLIGCRIANAVRCVPPENKPTGEEIATCRPFLVASLAEMASLQVIVALGRIAHDSVLTALGVRPARYAFGHGQQHVLGKVTLIDSYHCSRYNTNTRRLTPEMFRDVFGAVRVLIPA